MCALVTGVQTCALPISGPGARAGHPLSDGDAVAPDLWHSDGAYAVFRGGAGHRAAGFCRHGRARQVPDAGGGHRMIQAPDLPAWAAIIIGLLVLAGRAIALVGALGLLRLPTFYARVHATTLGATAGRAASGRARGRGRVG